jgi:hypothetical protein
LCSTNDYGAKNEKNFLVMEYLEVATLRAASSPFIAILPVFTALNCYLLNFELSIPFTGACGLGEHLSQVLYLSSWFHYGTRPYDGPFPALIFSS